MKQRKKRFLSLFLTLTLLLTLIPVGSNGQTVQAAEGNVFSTISGTWDLSRQHYGEVTLSNGGNGEICFNNKMKDMDLTIKVQKHPDSTSADARTTVIFNFNGKLAGFSVQYHEGKPWVQTMGGNGYITGWKDWYYLNADETNQYMTAEGIDFRVKREGTMFHLYIGNDRIVPVASFDLRENIGAEDEAVVSIRHWDDNGVDIRIPYTLEVPEEKVSFTVNGYRLGEAVSLTGKQAIISNDTSSVETLIGSAGIVEAGLEPGAYTVTVEGYLPGIVTVETDKTAKDVTLAYDLFKINSGSWELGSQNDGKTTLNNGGYGEICFNDKMKDMDLTIKVQKHPNGGSDARAAVIFNFNGKLAAFSVQYNNGKPWVQTMGGNDYITGWKDWYFLNAEEIQQYMTAEGIDFRVRRQGAMFYLYIGDKTEPVASFDLSESIGAEDEATVSIRHWDDGGAQIEIPFVLWNRGMGPINVSDITATGTTKNNRAAIGIETTEKYAVLTGTLKANDRFTNTSWPNVNIKVTSDTTDPFADTFQLVYREKTGRAVKIAYNKQLNSDGVSVSQEVSGSGTKADEIFVGEGIHFKVIRLDNWAYFLLDTEGKFEVFHRMPIYGNGNTAFTFFTDSFDANDSVTMSNITVAYGKEAAVDALAGSKFSFKNIGNVASVADSIYFPVDSTEWTLQARVSLPEYRTYVSDITGDWRAVHVGPGPGTKEVVENGKTVEYPYAWFYGLGINSGKNDSRWRIQHVGAWNGQGFIEETHVAMMDPDQGGMWLQWVRSGNRMSVYTSADGQSWTHVTTRTDLGDMEAGATGMYIDSGCKADLTDIKITLEKGTLRGATVSLGDNIGVNFYMELSREIIADPEAYVQFTLPGTNKTAEKVKVTEADIRSYNDIDCYVFSCGIAAKEMASDIKLKLVSGDGTEGTEYTYTVKEYGDTILADETGIYDADKAMIKAMLNYGAYAQLHFNNNTGNLANAGMAAEDQKLADVTISGYDMVRNGACTGLTYYGTSLMTTTTTVIRHYFELAEGARINDFIFTYGGTALTPKEKGGRYYVEIPNISASGLADVYTLTVYKGNETMILTYGPYTNIKAILAGSYDEATQKMMEALYWYGQEALKKNLNQ